MLSSLDWATISSLATAAGTLVLALATFAAVRSCNRSQRLAERAFQFNLRPILTPSHLEDPKQRIMFGDRHWVTFQGGRAAVEVADGVIYLAMGVRNIGNGIGVIEAWNPFPAQRSSVDPYEPVESFRPQSRSLWVPPGDVAFWQGALRDETEEIRAPMLAAIKDGGISVDLLYRDHEGGQRTISRFSVVCDDALDAWVVGLGSHRSLDD